VAKNGQPKCSIKLAANAKDADDLELGEWCVKDLPSTHTCIGATASTQKTILSTHSKSLSREIFKEIQRLSCCKAFQTHSIQRFIQETYNVLVDTTLIYNIGYRARAKLGIGEMERLFAQQKVYTHMMSL
jgi:hypothetical protein